MRALVSARRIGLVAGSCLALAASAGAIPISGTSSGVFVNPAPGSAVVTGVGTNDFTWGDGSAFGSLPNELEFTGTPFAGATGTPFSFGTLAYFNGTVAAGTEATSVDLSVTLTFTTPTGVVQAFTFPLVLINTPNVPGDDDASADIVRLTSGIAPEYFVVDGVSYSLEFLGFMAGGEATLDFRALEQGTASAELVGVVNPVPEPGTMALFGTGLLAARFVRTRRGRRRA
jgi:hypothetical protein